VELILISDGVADVTRPVGATDGGSLPPKVFETDGPPDIIRSGASDLKATPAYVDFHAEGDDT
jgi:hypothetical protein